MADTSIPQDPPDDQRRFAAFAAIVATTVLVCVAADLWLATTLEKSDAMKPWLPHIGVGRAILENVAAGALAAFLLAISYRWVIRWIDPSDRVLEIAAGTITDRLLKNASATLRYTFIGNTATFVTTSALAALSDSARTNSRVRQLTLYIIDPTDPATVSNYRNYSNRVQAQRTKVSDRVAGGWIAPTREWKPQTDEEVLGRLLSAIYLTAFSVSYQSVQAAIYLRRAFTPFRVDITDKESVITQEDISEAAVAFSSRGHFYAWYEKECDALRSQCYLLDVMSIRDSLIGKTALPTSPRQEIEAALRFTIEQFEYLKPLLANSKAIESAVNRIARHTNSYV